MCCGSAKSCRKGWRSSCGYTPVQGLSMLKYAEYLGEKAHVLAMAWKGKSLKLSDLFVCIGGTPEHTATLIAKAQYQTFVSVSMKAESALPRTFGMCGWVCCFDMSVCACACSHILRPVSLAAIRCNGFGAEATIKPIRTRGRSERSVDGNHPLHGILLRSRRLDQVLFRCHLGGLRHVQDFDCINARLCQPLCDDVCALRIICRALQLH